MGAQFHCPELGIGGEKRIPALILASSFMVLPPVSERWGYYSTDGQGIQWGGNKSRGDLIFGDLF